LPAILAIASEPLLNLADTAMIGNLGVEPLAAKAIASALFGVTFWIFIFLTFGTTTLVAHYYGAGDWHKCGEVTFHAVLLAILGGLLVCLLGFWAAPKLFSLMGPKRTFTSWGFPTFEFASSQHHAFFSFTSPSVFCAEFKTRGHRCGSAFQ
jgi:Na+-driven multidrug efflux pump